MKKPILSVLFGALLFYSLFLFCHKQTGGFQVTKVLSPLPCFSQWELPSLDPEEKNQLKASLSQPFYYLDKGGQCFAFRSQDGKTVLKLFKMQNLRQYTWGYRLPLPGALDAYRLEFLLSQKEKLQRAFSSSHLAYTQLREETGLIYLNLNPNPVLKDIPVTLVDKLGIQHRLTLDTLPCILQKYADCALPSLKRHIKRGEIAASKELIQQMIACITARQAKGIVDVDPALKRNMGFSEGKALFIDVGGFFPSTHALSQDTLLEETKTLRRFLTKHAPELVSYLDSLLLFPDIFAPSKERVN